MPRTAAVLIIGNEILTGKIQEANLQFLGRELFSLGIVLSRAVVCRDDIETIVDDLNLLRARHDYVFTSGGVGPTHDDVTLPAVARAFGHELTRDPDLARRIQRYYGDRCTEDHLRMASVPEGARLLSNREVRWPTIVIQNVYVFPGVPEIFRMKFSPVRDELDQGARFVSRAVYTHCDEGEIAGMLEELEHAYPRVSIGSYPRWGHSDYKVKVTFDGPDAEAVTQALDALLARLDRSLVVRVDT